MRRKECGHRQLQILLAAQDNLSGLLGDHVDRADDEQPGETRKNGSVDNTKAGGSMHAEVAVQHAVGIPWAYRTSRGCVMAPGVAADEISQLLVGSMFPRQFLDDVSPFLEGSHELSHKLNTFQQCLKVSISTLVKRIEIDVRNILRIAGAQRHFTSSVSGMPFQNDPG